MSTPVDLASRRPRRERFREALNVFIQSGQMPSQGDYLFLAIGNGIAYSSGDTGEIRSVRVDADRTVRFQLVDGTVLSIAPETVIMWEPKP